MNRAAQLQYHFRQAEVRVSSGESYGVGFRQPEHEGKGKEVNSCYLGFMNS